MTPAKQTKNLITRESVKEVLLVSVKRNIFSTLPRIVALPVLCAIWVACANSFFSLPYLAETPLVLLFLIFMNVCVAAVVCLVLFVFFRFFWERKKLLKGEFEIKLMPLSYKTETVRRQCRGRFNFFVFHGFEPFEPTETTYQLASSGDKFYIVHLRDRKSIKLVYSADTHEYKEK